MLLEMIGSMHPDASDPSNYSCDIGCAETLAAMVRMAFPRLRMSSWQIDESGGDHVLLVLEGKTPNEICPEVYWQRTWTAMQFSERGLNDRLAVLTSLMPNWTDAIETFYAEYRQDHPPGPVVVHGDLVPEHILIDEETRRVSGIIDFGDVALGDPAQDFLGFWTYGEDTARRVVDLYKGSAADPDYWRVPATTSFATGWINYSIAPTTPGSIWFVPLVKPKR